MPAGHGPSSPPAARPFPRWYLALAVVAMAASVAAAPVVLRPRAPGRPAWVQGPARPPAEPTPGRQGVPVQIQVNGQVLDLLTSAATVGDLLAEAGVRLGEQDRVEPGLGDPVTGNLQVRVVRVVERLATEAQVLPFATVRREDPDLVAGETREVRPGTPGETRLVYREVWEDGVRLTRDLVEEQVTRPPVDRVVAYGTAGVVSRGGVTYRYRRELVMTATGYAPGDGMTPGSYTATGVPARRGVVAVDPQVIPLGTRLYVEGYGPAVAADTGGAIKGMKIDLCFDSVAEANAFGLRPGVKVYVLD